jgi:hypothetical protein
MGNRPVALDVEIIRRTVMVTCPDNDHGGVHLPPADYDNPEGWRHAAMTRHPEIDGIDGPTISGAFVFHWLGTLTDGQIKHRSMRIIQALY